MPVDKLTRCCVFLGVCVVEQIKELNEPFQVKILNFNKSGVITTVEVHD